MNALPDIGPVRPARSDLPAHPAGSDSPVLAYVTEELIEAPAAAIWPLLTEVESWPRWWRYVARVDTLSAGDASGLGARRRLHWSTRLPYRIALVVECTESRREERLGARSQGDLDGDGLWELLPAPGGTRLRYTWCVRLGKPWMRMAAPLLEPVFRWNHDGVMAAGYAGLRRELGVAP